MPGHMDMTCPRESTPRRGYVQSQMAKVLDVPMGDTAAGLCTLKPVGYSRQGRPVYDPAEAVATMREYYRRLYDENKDKYKASRADMWRDYALKYRARMERCEALLAELERQGCV